MRTLLKLAHLVNPVLVKSSSDLYAAQPVTFESMRRARQQALGQVAVDLLAVGYEEDKAAMPDDFKMLAPLTRSVLDVADFEKPRKLPLLKDILQRLYHGSGADYLIYTNVDIGLQPDFYLALQAIIKQGFDAFVINRRTIPSRHAEPADLPQLWSEKGAAHRGWDCFIFHRDLHTQFVLEDVCIGAPRVGLALLANLVAVSDHFHEFKDKVLTFHLGDDRSWRDSTQQAYADHNSRELDIILVELEQRYGRFRRDTPPGAYLFKRRTFGRLYESWTRRANLPAGWSQRMNRLLGKLPGRR